MIHELVFMIVGIGGPATLFLYCTYLVIKSIPHRYTVDDEALKTNNNEVFTNHV